MTSFADRRRRLRSLVDGGETIATVGATDALSARLIAAAGFASVYIGSYATAASRFGLPDTGLLTLNDMVEQTRSIVDAVDLPVIADAESGFNDAPNIWRTVQAFERAGAAAIHIEDHAFGKHADVPQRLHPTATAAGRIRAAVEAREDPNFLIVARSDAAWVTGDVEETLSRLEAYAEAGAGAAIVLYYGFSALVQFDALTRALERFKSSGDAGTVPELHGRVSQFERFMGYDAFADRARRYGVGKE